VEAEKAVEIVLEFLDRAVDFLCYAMPQELLLERPAEPLAEGSICNTVR
jgi:hypothetical protein